MKNDIVDLVVAVHEAAAVARLAGRVAEEGDGGVVVRDLADGHARVDVSGLRLRLGDGGEGGELAVEEAGGLAEAGEVDRGGGDAVEFGEGADGVVPPGWIPLRVSARSKRNISPSTLISWTGCVGVAFLLARGTSCA